MKEFFTVMEPMQQIYWYVAIGASAIFIFQTIMTFAGADSDLDISGDADGAATPSHIFSMRNMINFLLGFGWTGVTLYSSIESDILLCVIAIAVGVCFVAVFFVIIKSLLRLSEDNTFKIRETIGKTGDVYMVIPGKAAGKGKVFISVRGSTRELSAVTYHDEDLKAGSFIKVVSIENGILIVTPYNKQ